MFTMLDNDDMSPLAKARLGRYQRLILGIVLFLASCSNYSPRPHTPIALLPTLLPQSTNLPTRTTPPLAPSPTPWPEPSPTLTRAAPTPSATLAPTATVTAWYLPSSTFAPTPLPPTPLPLPFTDGWLVYSSPWPYKGEMGLIRPNGTDGRLIPIVSAISDGLPQSPGVSESSITTGFNWSPDGRWLAFTFVDFGPTSTNSEIGIIRSDGSGFRRITFGPNFKYDPAWSPDGQFIAYSYFEYGNKGISDIAITRLDGSSTWQLTGTPDEDEKYPAWSPDGTKLAFLSNNMLMVIDADGKNRRSVTEDWLANGRIAWSPDGLQIAFSAGIGCGQIYAIALQGGQSRQITDFPGCASSPSWSPDGRYLAFIGTQPGANGFNDGDLYVISIVDNATPWLVLDAQQKGGLKYAPDNLSWSPVPSLLVGENYVITAIGANLNLRQSATLHGASLRRLAAGEIVTVLEGPLDAEDYYWWRLRTADGLEGWAVDWLGWYAPAAGAATPTPGP